MSKTELQSIGAGIIRLQQARLHIKSKFPYFYVTVLGLVPENVQAIQTLFVTDKMLLGIDYHWYSQWDVEVASGLLIHEALHILNDHLPRIVSFPQSEWELLACAFDFPINDMLDSLGVKLPPEGLFSKNYGFPKGLTGEKYYELLKNLPPDKRPKALSVGSGRCGTCSGGKPSPSEQKTKEQGRSESEVQYFKQAGKQALREAAKSGAFGRGNMPAFMEELLRFDGTEEAVVPWQQVVPMVLGDACGRVRSGQSDYSLRRPSRRSYAIGLLRPGLITYEPVVYFIEDSSGSMGSPQLRENRYEFAHAMMQLGFSEVWYLACDASVKREPIRIGVRELFTLPVVGRSGTNFIPAIERVMSSRPKPDIIFYSTDGDGVAPTHKPRGTEFVWLLAPGPWTRRPCDWGIQILTSNDRNVQKRYEVLRNLQSAAISDDFEE
jgi:predicted metal-dependent peptidase